MAFPTPPQSNSVMGKPRTGLPDNITVGQVIASLDDTRLSDYNLKYVLWEYQLKNGGNLTAFYGNPTKQVFVWANCSQRWWTFEIDLLNIRDSTMGMSSDGKFTGGKRGSDSPLGNNDLSSNTNSRSNTQWLSWDNIKREWISKSDFCDGGGVPEDDCKKYGINCPEQIATGKVYTKIDEADKLPKQSQQITYGIWTGVVGNLTTFHQPTLSGSVIPYHRTVYNKKFGTCDAEPQFDISYGHDAGSGSRDLGGHDRLTPTNAVYGQYRLLALGRDEKKFKLGSRQLNQIYIVNVRVDRMQERLDEGNIELNLAHLSGSKWLAGGKAQNAHTGSNVKLLGTGQTLRLIDDSTLNFGVLSTSALSGAYSEHADVKAHRVANGGHVYYMVSGSLERGIYNQSNPHIYGLLYPSLGFIILDGDKLDSSASFLSVTGSDVAGDNAAKIFTAISGAAKYTDPSGDYMGFQARRKETEFCEFFFIRVKNSDYNFSNNPTFVSGGYIISDFQETPKVYYSAVGLYNDRYECVAIGKITRPLLKTCTTEALLTAKIKY